MLAPLTKFNFIWKGKAVGVNDRYINRDMVLNPEYLNFKESIAWTIRQRYGRWASSKSRVKLTVHFSLDPARDSDSLLKPLFDGIELSALIKNDNQIDEYHVTPIERHKRGELDTILVYGEFKDAKEETPATEKNG